MDGLLTLVKLHLKVDESYDDPLIEFLVASALSDAEKYSGVPLKPGVNTEVHTVYDGGEILLKKTPNRIIEAIVLDPCGDVPVRFECDGRRVLVGMEWCGKAVRIKYRCGYACADELMDGEPDIIAGVLKYVAHAYEHHGDSDMGSWIKYSGALDHWQSRRAIAA